MLTTARTESAWWAAAMTAAPPKECPTSSRTSRPDSFMNRTAWAVSATLWEKDPSPQSPSESPSPRLSKRSIPMPSLASCLQIRPAAGLSLPRVKPCENTAQPRTAAAGWSTRPASLGPLRLGNQTRSATSVILPDRDGCADRARHGETGQETRPRRGAGGLVQGDRASRTLRRSDQGTPSDGRSDGVLTAEGRSLEGDGITSGGRPHRFAVEDPGEGAGVVGVAPGPVPVVPSSGTVTGTPEAIRVPAGSKAATDIAATRSGTKPMIGPPSLVGGSFGSGLVATIIVCIAASGIAMAKKPEWATGVVRVPAPSGKAISTVTAPSSPTRPNSSPPSLPGSTLNTTSPGCDPRGMQGVPVGPLRRSGAKYIQKPPFAVGAA